MSYAIIQLGGKQYKVSEGQALTVDRLPQAVGDEMVVSDVLLVASDKSVKVGTPLVAKASVTLKVTTADKGEKIRVFKYKSKSRYRKTHGHRQHLTTLEVIKITG